MLALSAAAGPHVSATKARAISMPAEMPEEARNFPSTTAGILDPVHTLPRADDPVKGQVIEGRTPTVEHTGGRQESRARADRHYLRRPGGQIRQLPYPLVVSDQSSRASTAGYQQNPLGSISSGPIASTMTPPPPTFTLGPSKEKAAPGCHRY